MFVPRGKSIQIRSMLADVGDFALLGTPQRRAMELAIDDFGPILGFSVDAADNISDLCSFDSGRAAAAQIVDNPNVLGVIGASCSTTAFGAMPELSESNLVMISPSATSPSLTASIEGVAENAWLPGFYRTSHSDRYQSHALASYAFNELGLRTAAAVSDGDDYTDFLAIEFLDHFGRLGGTSTVLRNVDPFSGDASEQLRDIASASPDVLLLAMFDPVGNAVLADIRSTPGLESTSVLATDALLVRNFVTEPHAAGVALSGPSFGFDSNSNESTGVSADTFIANYVSSFGERPDVDTGYWAHTYDATTMLLEAISASAVEIDGELAIDRGEIRTYLDRLRNYQGMSGVLGCDEFGDCAAQDMEIIRVTDDPDDAAATFGNVVFAWSRSPLDDPRAGPPLTEPDAEVDLGPVADILFDVVAITDTPERRSCMLDRIVSEGSTVDEANASESVVLIFALLGCTPDDEAFDFLFPDPDGVSQSTGLQRSDVVCVGEVMVDALQEASFAEAEELYSNDDVPDAIVTAAAATCGVSEEDAFTALNGG